MAKVLEIAGELAPVIAMVSRSRWSAGLSVAIKLADVGAKVYEEFIVPRSNPWNYFSDNIDSWAWVPKVFHNFILQRAEKVVVVAQSDSTDMPSAIEAYVGEIRIGWVGRTGNGDGKNQISSMYVWLEHEKLLRETFKEDVWRSHASKHLVLTPFAFEKEDELEVEGRFIQTNLIESVSGRVKAFLKDGVRSYLLVGLPGTGKTTCIQHVVRELGLRSLRIPLSEIYASAPMNQPEPSGDNMGLKSIVAVLEPEVIVLDDLDRAPPYIQDQLLEIMESFRQKAKVILVSANNAGDMDSALKRVERLDDHIEVPSLGKELVAEILGTEREHAERMADWPIGFINDYLKRVRVLGREKAVSEIPELERRVEAQKKEAAEPRRARITQLIAQGLPR